MQLVALAGSLVFEVCRLEVFRIVVDPVVLARTKKCVQTLKMKMRVEVVQGLPLCSPGR